MPAKGGEMGMNFKVEEGGNQKNSLTTLSINYIHCAL